MEIQSELANTASSFFLSQGSTPGHLRVQTARKPGEDLANGATVRKSGMGDPSDCYVPVPAAQLLQQRSPKLSSGWTAQHKQQDWDLYHHLQHQTMDSYDGPSTLPGARGQSRGEQQHQQQQKGVSRLVYHQPQHSGSTSAASGATGRSKSSTPGPESVNTLRPLEIEHAIAAAHALAVAHSVPSRMPSSGAQLQAAAALPATAAATSSAGLSHAAAVPPAAAGAAAYPPLAQVPLAARQRWSAAAAAASVHSSASQRSSPSPVDWQPEAGAAAAAPPAASTAVAAAIATETAVAQHHNPQPASGEGMPITERSRNRLPSSSSLTSLTSFKAQQEQQLAAGAVLAASLHQHDRTLAFQSPGDSVQDSQQATPSREALLQQQSRRVTGWQQQLQPQFSSKGTCYWGDQEQSQLHQLPQQVWQQHEVPPPQQQQQSHHHQQEEYHHHQQQQQQLDGQPQQQQRQQQLLNGQSQQQQQFDNQPQQQQQRQQRQLEQGQGTQQSCQQSQADQVQPELQNNGSTSIPVSTLRPEVAGHSTSAACGTAPSKEAFSVPAAAAPRPWSSPVLQSAASTATAGPVVMPSLAPHGSVASGVAAPWPPAQSGAAAFPPAAAAGVGPASSAGAPAAPPLRHYSTASDATGTGIHTQWASGAAGFGAPPAAPIAAAAAAAGDVGQGSGFAYRMMHASRGVDQPHGASMGGAAWTGHGQYSGIGAAAGTGLKAAAGNWGQVQGGMFSRRSSGMNGDGFSTYPTAAAAAAVPGGERMGAAHLRLHQQGLAGGSFQDSWTLGKGTVGAGSWMEQDKPVAAPAALFKVLPPVGAATGFQGGTAGVMCGRVTDAVACLEEVRGSCPSTGNGWRVQRAGESLQLACCSLLHYSNSGIAVLFLLWLCQDFALYLLVDYVTGGGGVPGGDGGAASADSITLLLLLHRSRRCERSWTSLRASTAACKLN